MPLRHFLIYASKRALPNRLRVRAVIAYQKLTNVLKYGDPAFPRSMCLEISVFCNRTCPYCPNVTNPTPKEFMPHDLFLLCLRRMREINWTGPVDYNFYNEPTLDPRLVEFIGLTKMILPKALPRVVTNGDFLTEEYMDRAIQAGITFFGVTRHPPFKPEWDARLRRLMAHPKYGAHITFGQILDTPTLSNRAGAVRIKNYVPLTKCHAPSMGLNILHNGDVLLCCADYHRLAVMGNIKRQTIMDIWHGEEFRRIRREVARGRPRLEICKACFGQ